MTDSDEPPVENEQPVAEGAEGDLGEADSPLRTDGGVAVSPDPSNQSGPKRSPGPRAPSIEDSIKPDAEWGQSSGGYDGTDPTNRPERGKRIFLAPFEELCGRVIDLQRTDVDLVVKLTSGTLVFPLNSTEAAICEDELEGNAGNWVSILRISDPDNPILVNNPESTEDT